MRVADAGAVAAIYAEGIAEWIATFETRAPDAEQVAGWVTAFPVVVVEAPDGRVVGWASAPAYRPARAAYAGVREFSVYVARDARGLGVGEPSAARRKSLLPLRRPEGAPLRCRRRTCHQHALLLRLAVHPTGSPQGSTDLRRAALALRALLDACRAAGHWKLVGRIFPENVASLALCRRLGFREVGVYRRHARLDGAWRDCVIVERLIGEAADGPR